MTLAVRAGNNLTTPPTTESAPGSLFAFPTTIFVGRDGRVRKIHSGFAGPGTGAHHQKLVAELNAVLDGLLAETAPAAPLAALP